MLLLHFLLRVVFVFSSLLCRCTKYFWDAQNSDPVIWGFFACQSELYWISATLSFLTFFSLSRKSWSKLYLEPNISSLPCIWLYWVRDKQCVHKKHGNYCFKNSECTFWFSFEVKIRLCSHYTGKILERSRSVLWCFNSILFLKSDTT